VECFLSRWGAATRRLDLDKKKSGGHKMQPG